MVLEEELDELPLEDELLLDEEPLLVEDAVMPTPDEELVAASLLELMLDVMPPMPLLAWLDAEDDISPPCPLLDAAVAEACEVELDELAEDAMEPPMPVLDALELATFEPIGPALDDAVALLPPLASAGGWGASPGHPASSRLATATADELKKKRWRVGRGCMPDLSARA